MSRVCLGWGERMTAFLMESVEDSTLALARFVANKLGAQQVGVGAASAE